MKRAVAVLTVTSAAMLGLTASTGATAAERSAGGARTHLGAVLVGGNEAPGPGDPNGYGLADVWVQGKTVCWRITVSEVEPPTAAHVHAGPAGVAGPVVVPLSPWSRGCTDVTQRTAKFLKRYADQFYVNVHNEEYPPGAVRGQLMG